MKSFNSKKYGFAVALTLLVLIFGCTSKTVCPEDMQHMAAEISSLSGPQSLNVGEQATITVGVRNPSSLCVKEANAWFTNVGLDTLLVSAELAYTSDPVPADCDCKRDTVIYTLLHFTPLTEGSYRIVTEGDSSITNIHPSDIQGFTIHVD